MVNKTYKTDKLRWLNQHGGRTIDDVLEDSNGEYVIMSGGRNKEIKVYISCEQSVEKWVKGVDKNVNKLRTTS